MKAFWWYRENFIAGMARPGFNSCRWFDLPFDEAMVMGWLGQHSAGPLSLDSFKVHLKTYLPKAIYFYQLDELSQRRFIDDLEDTKALESIICRLSERSKFLTEVAINDTHLHFEINRKQVDSEITFLKNKNINRIVSLTEEHHISEYLSEHFKLNHISIIDMGAPTEDQAQHLAEILETSEKQGERIAVHCLAGIGRTSTMLMAAEILRGKSLVGLLNKIQQQNPSYVFVGAQAAFIQKLYQQIKKD